MPRNTTKTQSRNAQLRALWSRMPDAEFERLGFTRAQLFSLQNGLSGYVVLPGMPDYNRDRKLFDPVFDSYPAAIAYCESEGDVAAVLLFAQTRCEIVTASETANRDVWWAMRGGTGGNFGVLLSARYKLRPLGDVFGWAAIWPLAGARDTANATGALMLFQSNYLGANTNPLLNIQVLA